MKKLMCVLLTGIMISSLTACGQSQSSENADNSQKDSEAAAENVAESPIELTDEEITLTFWNIWPEGEQLHDVITDYIEQYESAHPNIHIENVAASESDYQNTKLKVAAADGSQGDIFMSWGAGYSQTFVDSGTVLKLDDYYEAYGIYDQLLEGATTYCTYDDGVYGLPLKQWAGVLYCNKDIFDEYDLEIPETWDDLMNCVEVFRSNDVTPMVLGAKDAWHIGMIQNALAIRTAGADYMNEALSGNATFDCEAIIQSAELLCELNDADAFCKGTLGVSSDEAEEEFYSGLVPMFYGGSWAAAGVDSDENATSEANIVVTTMPTVEGGAGDATQYSGGVIDFFMINANTEHPDEAFDFAYGMTKYMSSECYRIGDSLPCWKDVDVDESEVSKTLVAIQEMIQDSTNYVLAWDTFLEGSAIDAHYNLLQGLIEGSVSPEEFAAQMEEAQQEVLADKES